MFSKILNTNMVTTASDVGLFVREWQHGGREVHRARGTTPRTLYSSGDRQGGKVSQTRSE
jgi:hypothetical protein